MTRVADWRRRGSTSRVGRAALVLGLAAATACAPDGPAGAPATSAAPAAMQAATPKVWVPESVLLADDGAEDHMFGASVAVAGNKAVVGAPGDNSNGQAAGSAYVFVRDRLSWPEQHKLSPDDGAAHAAFGASVAVSGDTAVVGAPYPLDDGTGAAYVFVGGDSSWTQQQKLLPGDTAPQHNLGAAVAVSGNTAVLGAPDDDPIGLGSGSAYVFVRSGTLWSLESKLSPADGAIGDHFGASIAITGDTAVVGAPGDDVSGQESGSAYVFVRSGGAWSLQQKLLHGDDGEGDAFGTSVAVGEDRVVVGAPGDDGGKGSAYVFVRSGTTWSLDQKLSSTDQNDGFGNSVAIWEDTVVVGVPRDDSPETDSGRAYVFARMGSDWSQLLKIVPDDGGEDDLFGQSVAISGDTFIVGAPGLNSDEGIAYAYRRGCSPEGTCPGGYYCGPDKTCQPRKAQGDTCSPDSECLDVECDLCATGFCVDGFCCDQACTGQCEACDNAVPGLCLPVLGEPHGARPACPPGASESCQAGQCDGSDRHECVRAHESGTICGVLGCESASLAVGACTGDGQCVEAFRVPCNGFACGSDGACKTSCESKMDCAKGYACSDGLCSPSSACESVDDCVAPYVCREATKTCVLPGAPSAAPAACGCSAPGSDAGPRSGWLLVVAAAGVVGRRRAARRGPG